jgi:hypothetical protein
MGVDQLAAFHFQMDSHGEHAIKNICRHFDAVSLSWCKPLSLPLPPLPRPEALDGPVPPPCAECSSHFV